MKGGEVFPTVPQPQPHSCWPCFLCFAWRLPVTQGPSQPRESSQVSLKDSTLPNCSNSGVKFRSHFYFLLIEDINALFTVCPQESLLTPGGSVFSGGSVLFTCPEGPQKRPPETTEHTLLFLSQLSTAGNAP